MATMLPDQPPYRSSVPATGSLSCREREVFKLLAQGLSGAEIAQRLMLSAETVRTHVRNGSKRLAARTRVHAIVLAVKSGEIEL
jgi:DNA-binding CsgD family transcriptional regulator